MCFIFWFSSLHSYYILYSGNRSNMSKNMEKLFQTLPHDIGDKIQKLQNILKPTKYHRETFFEHCANTGANMDLMVKERNPRLYEKYCHFTHMNFNFFELIGIFHDIGKPFVMETMYDESQCQVFSGHAQCGAYIFSRLFNGIFPSNISQLMAWCIDNHMCALRENNANADIKAYLQLTRNAQAFDYDDAINLLFHLQEADTISRSCDGNDKDDMAKSPMDYDTYMDFAITPPQQLYLPKKEKIVVLLLGQASSGRTTFAEQLLKELPPHMATAVHLQREVRMRQFAGEMGICGGDDGGDGGRGRHSNIEEIRNVLKERNLFEKFQATWEKYVEEKLNDPKIDICIMDTTQCLFPNAKFAQNVRKCLSNNDKFFKIGVMFAQQHLFAEDTHVEKRRRRPQCQWKYSGRPPPTYPIAYTECKIEKNSHYECHIVTGLTSNVANIIRNYMELPESKWSLVELLNFYKSPDLVLTKFSLLPVRYHPEYQSSDLSILTFDYRNLKHHNVPTNDYRGETVYMSNGKFQLLRGSLRVWDTVRSFDDYFSRKPHFAANHRQFKFIACSKIDGSLLNITFIPKNDPINDTLYRTVFQQLQNGKIFSRASGTYVIGHRSKFITKNESILKTLSDAIGDWGKFIDDLELYAVACGIMVRTTFHFEFRSLDFHDNLTVYYDEGSFVKFLGTTTFSVLGQKQFKLPVAQATNNNIQLVNGNVFADVDSMKAFVDFNEGELSTDHGGHVEPEGFVIHVVDVDSDCICDSFKYKFPNYFVAHKPNFHDKETIDSIISNPNLAQRFLKFRDFAERKRELLELIRLECLKLNLKDIGVMPTTKNEIYHALKLHKGHVATIEKLIKRFTSQFLFTSTKIKFFNILLCELAAGDKIDNNFSNIEDAIVCACKEKEVLIGKK